MDLLGTLVGDESLVSTIGAQAGLDSGKVSSVLEALAPVLGKGLSRNAAAPGGLENLLGALSGGNHERYLEDPEALRRPEGIADGNAILGHILGDKDVSRAVAGRAAEQTGVGAAIIKQILPMVAGAAMGALGRQTRSADIGADRSAAPSALAAFLDADQDGSMVDDLLDMASRFLRR